MVQNKFYFLNKCTMVQIKFHLIHYIEYSFYYF